MSEQHSQTNIAGIIQGLNAMQTTSERRAFLLAIPYDLLAEIGRSLQITFHEIRHDKTFLLESILKQVDTPNFKFYFAAQLVIRVNTEGSTPAYQYHIHVDGQRNLHSKYFETSQEAQRAGRAELALIAKSQLLDKILEDPHVQ